ncbi:MAG: class I SAM-dependent methyltransferase [Chloroflexota bacterium]
MARTNRWVHADHARAYLDRADRIPHRREGESVLLDHLPGHAQRVLDLGTGDGRLLHLVKQVAPHVHAVAIDFSPTMLAAARERFAADPLVTIVQHDLETPLPSLGRFDTVISSFAIHHLAHERKQELYAEIFSLLEPGGVFCNLEHVASPTQRLHERFLIAMGQDPTNDDPSNRLLAMETQLTWLRQIGFTDVDCYWKWLELALLIGANPAH